MSADGPAKGSLHQWAGTTASTITVAAIIFGIVAGAAVVVYRIDQQDRRNDQQDRRMDQADERADKLSQDIRNRFDNVIQAQSQQGAKLEMIYDRVREKKP